MGMIWVQALPCCGGMQCKNLLGGSGKVCEAEQPLCVHEGSICGGPGQLSQSCCDDLECQRLFGGSEMKCATKQPHCVPEHGTCGGPGQLTQSCCGSTECTKLMGGEQMECVSRQTLASSGSHPLSAAAVA